MGVAPGISSIHNSTYLKDGILRISSGNMFENYRTTRMSLREGSAASVFTTLHKNPSHPLSNNLWTFITVISFTPSLETLPLCTTFSPLGPLRVILHFGQFIEHDILLTIPFPG